jgi:hypothetical protein
LVKYASIQVQQRCPDEVAWCFLPRGQANNDLPVLEGGHVRRPDPRDLRRKRSDPRALLVQATGDTLDVSL